MNKETEQTPAGKEPVITSDSGALAGTHLMSSEEKKGKMIDSEETAPRVDQNDPVTSDEDNVSAEERELLDRSENFMPVPDEDSLQNARLDDTDADGDPLNEDNLDASGKDLDVPGSESDDSNEDIGEEDEENNPYSLGGDAHD